MLIQDTVANQSTESKAIPTSEIPDDLMLRRISVLEYHEMIRAGILQSGDPVELLEGWLVEKMSKNPSHRIATNKLAQQLNRLMPAGWHVQQQDPITLSDSEPEPDLTIVRGNTEDYDVGHPGPSNIALVVEVSDATINRDQGTKKRLYAKNGIVEYWLVNLIEGRIEVYTQPLISASRPDYQYQINYYVPDAVPFLLDSVRIAEIPVDEILPRVKA